MTKNFEINDRPIHGDISHSDKQNVEQVTAARFLELVDGVLNSADFVTGLIWEQYTPYFNDGEPCEFGLHELRVLLKNEENSTLWGDEDDESPALFKPTGYTEYNRGYTADELWDYKPGETFQTTVSGSYWSEEGRTINRDKVNFVDRFGRNLEPVYDALSQVRSGAVEAVARKNFGDHAQVTATREGFSVEYYSHD